MQTYWDHTQKERAAMTKGDVEKFLDAELMTKGVLKVGPPQLEDVPTVPDVPKQTMYQVDATDPHYSYSRRTVEAIFASADDASAFLALNPKHLTAAGSHGNYAEPFTDTQIKPVAVMSHQDYLNSKSAIEAASAIKDANEAAEREYNKASEESRKVLNGVWDDWRDCREIAANHKRVLDTFDDYKKTAGDETVAAEFLKKAFEPNAITKAFEWFNQASPVDNGIPACEPVQ